MQSLNNSAASSDPERKEFLIHEYDALRQEILKHMEIEHQKVTLVLTIFALVLGLKLTEVSALPLFAYPVVALALSLGWYHSDARSHEIGTYINDHIESVVEGDKIGWEHHLVRPIVPDYWYRGSVIAIFLVTELIAIVLAISLPLPSGPPLLTPIEKIAFLGTAIVSCLATGWVFGGDLKIALTGLKELHAWCWEKFLSIIPWPRGSSTNRLTTDDIVKYSMSQSIFYRLCGIASLYTYPYEGDEDTLRFLIDHGFIQPTKEPGADIDKLKDGDNLVALFQPTLIGWFVIKIRVEKEKKLLGKLKRDVPNVKDYVWEELERKVKSLDDLATRIALRAKEEHEKEALVEQFLKEQPHEELPKLWHHGSCTFNGHNLQREASETSGSVVGESGSARNASVPQTAGV